MLVEKARMRAFQHLKFSGALKQLVLDSGESSVGRGARCCELHAAHEPGDGGGQCAGRGCDQDDFRHGSSVRSVQ
ncbi:MAG TPA: hypothetical protein PKE27_06335 [Povalibacter sp.]|nr:hypothetical protein [Povalibacter sp.]